MGRSAYNRGGKRDRGLSRSSSAATFLSGDRGGGTSGGDHEAARMIQPSARSESGGFSLRNGGVAPDGFGWDSGSRASLPGRAGRQAGPAAWVTYGIQDSVSGPARISRDPVGVISRGKIRALGSSRFERIRRNRVIFILILAAMAGIILYQVFLAG